MNDDMNLYDEGMYSGNDDYAPVVTMKEWIITMLLLCIPIANIVLPFVWAFGSDVNPSKKNYFRVLLIFMAIGLFVSIVFSTALVSLLASSIQQQY